MKKWNIHTRLSCFVLAIVMLFALTGCAQSGNDTSNDTETTPSAVTEATETIAVTETEVTEAVETEATEEATEVETQPNQGEQVETEPSHGDNTGATEPPASEETEAPHEHEYTKTVTKPTCTSKGYTTYKCACGDTYTANEVAAAGHDYKSEVVAPTTSAQGYTLHTCKTCGDSYKDNYTDKLHEHSYTSTVTKPTCTAKGYTTYKCACGDTYTDNEVAATGHDYKTEVVAPTTSAQGYTLHTCKVCGDSYKDNYTDKLPVETQPEETEPVGCQHSWQAVDHPEVGHEEHFVVCDCGYRCKTSAEWGAHAESYSLEDMLLYHGGHGSADIYIIDTPAYTEWICSECGAATTTKP